jgi:hypothetical protein
MAAQILAVRSGGRKPGPSTPGMDRQEAFGPSDLARLGPACQHPPAAVPPVGPHALQARSDFSRLGALDTLDAWTCTPLGISPLESRAPW